MLIGAVLTERCLLGSILYVVLFTEQAVQLWQFGRCLVAFVSLTPANIPVCRITDSLAMSQL